MQKGNCLSIYLANSLLFILIYSASLLRNLLKTFED